MAEMKKPDRFDLIAQDELAAPWELNAHRLAMLLRREQTRVVRLIRRQLYKRPPGVQAIAYEIALHDILAALAKRKKGTR